MKQYEAVLAFVAVDVYYQEHVSSRWTIIKCWFSSNRSNFEDGGLAKPCSRTWVDHLSGILAGTLRPAFKSIPLSEYKGKGPALAIWTAKLTAIDNEEASRAAGSASFNRYQMSLNSELSEWFRVGTHLDFKCHWRQITLTRLETHSSVIIKVCRRWREGKKNKVIPNPFFEADGRLRHLTTSSSVSTESFFDPSRWRFHNSSHSRIFCRLSICEKLDTSLVPICPHYEGSS